MSTPTTLPHPFTAHSSSADAHSLESQYLQGRHDDSIPTVEVLAAMGSRLNDQELRELISELADRLTERREAESPVRTMATITAAKGKR